MRVGGGKWDKVCVTSAWAEVAEEAQQVQSDYCGAAHRFVVTRFWIPKCALISCQMGCKIWSRLGKTRQGNVARHPNTLRRKEKGAATALQLEDIGSSSPCISPPLALGSLPQEVPVLASPQQVASESGSLRTVAVWRAAQCGLLCA